MRRVDWVGNRYQWGGKEVPVGGLAGLMCKEGESMKDLRLGG